MGGLLRGSLPVLAIDGPAGAGKSTVSREVAGALGWQFVDSGAMYRAVAVMAGESGTEDEAGWAQLMSSAEFTFEGRVFRVNGGDFSRIIRTPEATAAVKAVADSPQVRKAARRKQQEIASRGKVVMEGRDIGTFVVPGARYKFFLDASIDARAERRWKDLAGQGMDVPLERVREDIRRRDEQDRNRPIAPLMRAEDAFYLDTTWLTRKEVVELITGIVKTDVG